MGQEKISGAAGTFVNAFKKSCVSCAYSIDVRNVKYGLPYRTYIWEGGKGVDTNKDGHIGDNPTTPDVVEGADEKETSWCFAYGEKEWMAGKIFKTVSKEAEGSLDKPAKGRINCTTGVSL